MPAVTSKSFVLFMSYPNRVNKLGITRFSYWIAKIILISQLAACSTHELQPVPSYEDELMEPESKLTETKTPKPDELKDDKQIAEQSREEPRKKAKTSGSSSSEKAEMEEQYSTSKPKPAAESHEQAPANNAESRQKQKDDTDSDFMKEKYATDKPDHKQAKSKSASEKESSEKAKKTSPASRNAASEQDKVKQSTDPEKSASSGSEQAKEETPAGKPKTPGGNSSAHQAKQENLMLTEDGNSIDDHHGEDLNTHLHGHNGTHDHDNAGHIYPIKKTRYWNMQRPQKADAEE